MDEGSDDRSGDDDQADGGGPESPAGLRSCCGLTHAASQGSVMLSARMWFSIGRRYAPAPSSTLLGLAMARLSGVPLERDHQAERSAPPPPVARHDTHTTSPHPHPPDRVRRGPVRLRPPQG